MKINPNEKIPLLNWNLAKDLFDADLINKVLYRQSPEKIQFTPSFIKGDGIVSFIGSGVIDGKFTTKIHLKQKENQLSLFNHSCNCSDWSEDSPCLHVINLYLKCIEIKNRELEENSEPRTVSTPHEGTIENSVHPYHFQKIVNSPKDLNNAPPYSTYSTLQYMLVNRKVVHFPFPKDLKDPIIINIAKDEFDKTLYEFSLKTEKEIIKQISLFEDLYLFNWQSGEAFNLTSSQKEIINKISKFPADQDYILSLKNQIESANILIEINKVLIDEIDIVDKSGLLKIEVIEGSKNVQVSLSFLNKTNSLEIPVIFKLLAIYNGLLDSFGTKKEAHEFVLTLAEDLTNNTKNCLKSIHLLDRKDEITLWLNQLYSNYDFYFQADEKLIGKFESLQIKKLFITLISLFDYNLIRHSHFERKSKRLRIEMPSKDLFEKLGDHYNTLKELDIQIQYQNHQVSSWRPNLKFERNNSEQDWFSLDLYSDPSDLEIIKATKDAENFIIHNNQLLFFDKSDQEIIKIIRKYTYEKSNTTDGKNKISLNLNRARIFELFELKRLGITGALTTEEERLCEDLLNMKEMPAYELPEQYVDIARDYQKTGYSWLRFLYQHRFGACLADDMGLGKTIQAIMFIQSIVDKVEKVLIICPVSIITNWQKEFEKFSEIDTHVYYGPGRSLDPNAKVILTSYGVMRKEATSTFGEMSFDILVMDEVQHLKNIKSFGAHQARQIKSKFRICLTGTPVENDLMEFYNILDLAIPGLWGDQSFLRKSNEKSRLNAKLTAKPFILRRTKKEVLAELPEKIENQVFLDFSPKEREFYLKELTRIKLTLDANPKANYTEVLKSLLRLRQLCLWQDQQEFFSTKINFLLDTVEQLQLEGHQVLIFSQFTTYLNHIQKHFNERKWDFARIDGSQTMQKRVSEVDRFQKGEAKLFLISLKAGGVGLNLTQANYIFLMDPWWNPAVENQAIDRAHRIGQEKKVTVYRPLIKNSVEEKVLALQEYKRELFNEILDDDDKSFYQGNLTKDDFMMLLDN